MHRNYDNAQERVKLFYREHHAKQTYEEVQKLTNIPTYDNKLYFTEALQLLNTIVDQSDPDTKYPQTVHLYQTAESLRKMYPDKDWLHLVGLIHDMGKILQVLYKLPDYFVVGDTYPLGCSFSNKIVYNEYLKNNPDSNNPIYSDILGIYEPNIGLDNVCMTYGHDEYLYQVLTINGNKLPQEALYIIRYHSFYSWHTGGDYNYLCSDLDKQMLPYIQMFQKHDLYSKIETEPIYDTAYYNGLVDKYLKNPMFW